MEKKQHEVISMFKSAHVYYFTGTGNTQALATAATDALSLCGVQAEPINLQAFSGGEMPELIGVFFPVYCFGAPRVVNRFLLRLPQGNGSKAMVIANAAGAAGPAAAMVAETLNKKGYEIVLADWIKMPSNYILGREAVEETMAHQIVLNGQARVKQLVEALLNSEAGLVKRSWQPAHRLMHWGFLKGLNYMHRFYKYNDKCTGCGACVEMCPTGSIALDATERPNWRRGCEHCLRCVNLCPYAAIEITNATRGKRRYTYWRGKV